MVQECLMVVEVQQIVMEETIDMVQMVEERQQYS